MKEVQMIRRGWSWEKIWMDCDLKNNNNPPVLTLIRHLKHLPLFSCTGLDGVSSLGRSLLDSEASGSEDAIGVLSTTGGGSCGSSLAS
jgi:hypothetical protein